MNLEGIIPPTQVEMENASGISKSAAKDWAAYCKGCRRRYKIIKSMLEELFEYNLEGKNILDWGCAAGGVSILIDDNLPLAVTAADVDKHSIAWLTKSCNTIACETLQPGKVLPFGDNSFDAVYGISVLTHIPIELQDFYLSELHRITKKDGVVIVTVLSYSKCDSLLKVNKGHELSPNNRKHLQKEGILFYSYPKATLNNIGFTKDTSYGVTYHSTEYIHENFGRYFRVDSVEECGMGKQDIVTLIK
jgi:ubiquinone/menaquinone biosynthesis C-methylase UbiE